MFENFPDQNFNKPKPEQAMAYKMSDKTFNKHIIIYEL